MDWHQGASPREKLPKAYGVYCEIVWPVRGIRIGISKNIWARHGNAASWMRSMKKGSGSRARRVGPYANHAKDWGDLGLETFVLSTDPRPKDENLRYECETHLHRWAEEQSEWKNFNAEKWRPKNYGIPVLDEAAAAKAWGVELIWSLPQVPTTARGLS
ncbi:hypothetical protein [Ruegeria intermedia]|nr:hypothetical protein [Ruegeria intermedia]